MRKVIIFFTFIFPMIFSTCAGKVENVDFFGFIQRIVIQHIEFDNKIIEVYIFNFGINATPTIEVGIFPNKINKKLKGNIFSASAHYNPIINVRITEKGELEVLFQDFRRVHGIDLQVNIINGINVIYTDCAEKKIDYKFVGTDVIY
jgi:hypothetical protein